MNAPADPTTLAQSAALADQPIGQIAVNLPGATAVFRRAKLDFCCGGQISLRQAVADKRLVFHIEPIVTLPQRRHLA